MIVPDQADYQKSNAVSFSWLKRFEQDEERFYRRFVLGEECDDEESDSRALLVGTAAHCFILEGPEVFASRFAIAPETYPGKKGEPKPWTMRAKVCQEWEAAQVEQGRQVVSQKEAALLAKMRRSMMDNPEAVALLSSGVPELAIRRTYPELGFNRQGRLDWINHDVGAIVDIKTIEDANDRHIERERRLYYRQLPYYQDLAEEEFGREYSLKLIWLEKRWPYRCLVETLSQALIDAGRRQNFASLTRLADKYRSGGWAIAPKAAVVEPSVYIQLAELEAQEAEAGEQEQGAA